MPAILPNEPDPTPATNTPPATPPVTPPANTPPPAPPVNTRQVNQREYDELLRKASHYDLLESDPEIVEKIHDHVRAKTGRLGTAPRVPPVNTPNTNEEDPRIKSLNETVQGLTRQMAIQELRAFKQAHPDMDEYKDDMTGLVQRGVSLEDAYRFSKAAKSQASQKPVVTPPVAPTTETNRNAGEFGNNDATRSEVIRKINDPKATPRLDDALDLAFAEAKRQLAGQ